NQWPSFEMPMGTGSYLSGSSPRITDAAEASETSCSPLRPPNRTPTRNRFFSGVTRLFFQKNAPLRSGYLLIVSKMKLALGTGLLHCRCGCGHFAFWRNGQPAVSAVGEGEEIFVLAQGGKDFVHARFHHFLRADRFVAFVLKEVAL